MYQVCIFDLDGTLTDTLDSLELSVNLTLKEMRLEPIAREDVRAFVGNGVRILMQKALKRTGADDSRLDEAMERFSCVFAENGTYNVKPYDGIPELLEEIKKLGVRLAVLSNKPHAKTVEIVGQFFDEGIFEWVQGQQDDIPRKPHPQAALHIAESLGVSPEDCVYIGDSEVDVATALNAEMDLIGVTWGFRGYDLLIEAGAKAEYIVDSPEQILDLIN